MSQYAIKQETEEFSLDSLGNGNIQEGSRFIPSSPDELKLFEKEQLRNKNMNGEMPVQGTANIDSGNSVTEGSSSGGISNTFQESRKLSDSKLSNSSAASQSTLSNSIAYPVLLSLHGSGIAPLDQANSYKFKPKSNTSDFKDYIYGVEGFWVIAPTRFGAHNWEGIGELSARRSIFEVQRILSHFPLLLPEIWPHDGIIAGHSMGAHGALLLAANDPQNFACAIATAGWIRKEEYDVANSFFYLDVQNSHVSPILKSIFARSMSEYHVDRFAGNMLQVGNIHLRVGSEDQTTNPWFSRRMYRLLTQQNHRSVVLEEVPQRQHWWWDTAHENDGGVMNDEPMRSVYHRCLIQSNIMQRARKMKMMRFSKVQLPHVSAHGDLPINSTSDNDASITGNTDDFHTKKQQVISQRPRNIVRGKYSAESSTKRQDNKEVSSSSSKEKIITDSSPEEDEEDISSKDVSENHPCLGEFTVEAINLAYSRGLCGFRILQQLQQLEKSVVRVQCSKLDDVVASQLTGILASNVFSEKKAKSTMSIDAEKSDKSFGTKKNVDSEPEAASGNTFQWLDSGSPSMVISNDSSRVYAAAFKGQNCKITTRNVLRMSITFNPIEIEQREVDIDDASSTYLNNRKGSWTVDRRLIDMNHADDLYTNTSTINLCWIENQSPEICKEHLNALKEKSPALQGPLRMVTTKPLLIVYGTPRSSSSVRVALKDFAIYIANAYAAAHGNFVRVITDLEYRAGNYAENHGPESTNLLLLGGPSHNKVTKALHDSDHSVDSFVPFVGQMPITFHGSGNRQQHILKNHRDNSAKQDVVDEFQAQATYSGTGWFQIGDKSFDAELNSVLFAFPYSSSSHAALAVCLSSNSVEGYTHALRLAWPTVPPMVRAPFANYMPDYVVFDESIWLEGFGGVAMAGYWDTWWKYDAAQAFVR